MRSRRLGVLAVALAIGVAGCGGSDEPTRAEFIEQANAICKQSRASATRFVTANVREARSSADAMSEFVLAIVARQEALVKRLTALESPAALKVDYAAYLATLRGLNETQRDVVRLTAPSASGDVRGRAAAAKVSHRRGEAHKAVRQAHAIGFKYCGA